MAAVEIADVVSHKSMDAMIKDIINIRVGLEQSASGQVSELDVSDLDDTYFF